MPYLRFSRDQRGYESTYVLHTGRDDEGRQRPRMLYWFRTPPNVRVGRLPLDEEAIRAIEGNNPDLAFDWTKILKIRSTPRAGQSQKFPESRPARRRPRRGETRPGGEEKPGDDVQIRPAAPVAVPEAPSQSAAVPLPAHGDRGQDEAIDADLLEAESHLQDAEGSEPTLADDRQAVLDDGEHPVAALMGHETLARLRGRYAEMQTRISEKEGDAAEQEELRAQAESVNPDRWTGVEEAVRGIERFEAEVEALKARIGRRPARRSRQGRDV